MANCSNGMWMIVESCWEKADNLWKYEDCGKTLGKR